MTNILDKYSKKIKIEEPKFKGIKIKETESETKNNTYTQPPRSKSQITYPDDVIPINCSTIKRYTYISFDKKEIYIHKERCPYNIQFVQNFPTIDQLKGLFFETLGLGCDSRGVLHNNLPRTMRGNKTIDHQRIEEQAQNFKGECLKLGIDVSEKNTQVYVDRTLKINSIDSKIVLHGTIDIRTSLNHQGRLQKACIDLKLTGRLDNTYGPYAWGRPENMDHLQLHIYEYITNEPQFYWVYEYKKPALDNIMLYETADEDDVKNMLERIRLTVIQKQYDKERDYPRYGTYENCRYCPENIKYNGDCVNSINIKTIKN